jgi:selenocysteine-specific elongation factor
VIIGTAGHIDHGKSALVEALTGQGMDPLAEERRRGITIDLHFASLPLADDAAAGVVDVPGHEDLVRTMVAGAAGIDLVLLVVAADEGIMPQTREHLAVVEQLRIPVGIPVITKADLVPAERLSTVETEVAERLRNSQVAFSAPVATSTRTGVGLEVLRDQITARSRALLQGGRSGRGGDDLPRLPIDRSFSLPGAGTVVTGTSWSGVFKVGDQVRVMPTDARARIRSLERHGIPVSSSLPGERIAVALAGIDREQLQRGQVLVADGDPWEVTRAIDVRLELLSSPARSLAHQARVRVHLGTLEVLARVKLKAPIAAGQSGNARLVLEHPAVARGGDRLVLRSFSPVTVIGGGWVLDPLPPPGRPTWPTALASETLEERMLALLSRRPRGIVLAQLPVLLGASPEMISPILAALPVEVVGTTIVEWERVEDAERVAHSTVRAHHLDRPGDSGIPLETLRQRLSRYGPAGEAALDRLVARKTLLVDQGVIREPHFQAEVAGGGAMLEILLAAIGAAGLTPPSVGELEASFGPGRVADVLRLAAKAGRLVPVERDRYFSPVALKRFATALSEAVGRGAITPAGLRDATGISRKFLIPLLEWADRTGLTIRRGEGRIPGPGLRVVTRRET